MYSKNEIKQALESVNSISINYQTGRYSFLEDDDIEKSIEVIKYALKQLNRMKD